MTPLLRFLPDLRPFRGVYIWLLVLTAFASAISLVIPVLIGWAIDGPIAARDLPGLWLPVLAVLGIGIIEALALFVRRLLTARVTSTLEIGWRRRLFSHLQRISIARHDSWESGQLLSRSVQDLSQLRRFAAFGAPFLITTPITLAVGLIALTVYAPVMTAIFLVSAIPTVVICFALLRRFDAVSRSVQDQDGGLTTRVEESVQGIRILRAFGRGPSFAREFARRAGMLRSTELERARLDSWFYLVLILLPSLATGLGLAYGTWLVVQGELTIGSLVAAITVMTFLRMPIEMLAFLVGDAFLSAAAATRYWEAMDTPLEIADPDEPREVPATTDPATVVFEDVSFRFADGSADVLSHLDLTLEPGSMTALVGATGSGKTALAGLIPRLNEASRGAVRLDGVDVRELRLAELRDQLAVAFDEPILFSASVRDNILMGDPDADDEAVFAALEVAQVAETVRNLPEGLDTQIGEQGLSLSGGQRQRLALARAIIGRPRVLVLDDPLSAVDVETEERVQSRLHAALGGVTSLVIAHRPSTAALADRVALLQNGAITAIGTHAELLRDVPAYRTLMGAVEVSA